jgi:hypothetical protein
MIHGTYAGAQTHLRNHEKPCGSCRTAATSYMRMYRRRRVGAPRYSWRDRDRGLTREEKVIQDVRLAVAAAADEGAPLQEILIAVHEGHAASWVVLQASCRETA